MRKVGNGQSLFEIGTTGIRLYLRYSRVHPGTQAFYGLRESDLRNLQGHAAFICLLWDDQPEPLLIPFSDYAEVFANISPASDGQFKAQIHLRDGATQLYVARAGRFGVDEHIGYGALTEAVEQLGSELLPQLSHAQVQSILGAIGTLQGHEVWVPTCDRLTLDFSLVPRYACRESLPPSYDAIQHVLQEVDVVWIEPGSSKLQAFGVAPVQRRSPNLTEPTPVFQHRGTRGTARAVRAAIESTYVCGEWS